jgi:hypothetical protein
MQEVQKQALLKGAIWLTICTAKPGDPGYLKPEEAKQKLLKYHSQATAYLLDTDGRAAKDYYIAKTPQFVVLLWGKLAYNGMLGNLPDNVYVQQAIEHYWKGKWPNTLITTPYGCDLSYGNGKK